MQRVVDLVESFCAEIKLEKKIDIEQKIQAIENAEYITLKETQYFADVINDYFS